MVLVWTCSRTKSAPRAVPLPRKLPPLYIYIYIYVYCQVATTSPQLNTTDPHSDTTDPRFAATPRGCVELNHSMCCDANSRSLPSGGPRTTSSDSLQKPLRTTRTHHPYPQSEPRLMSPDSLKHGACHANFVIHALFEQYSRAQLPNMMPATRMQNTGSLEEPRMASELEERLQKASTFGQENMKTSHAWLKIFARRPERKPHSQETTHRTTLQTNPIFFGRTPSEKAPWTGKFLPGPEGALVVPEGGPFRPRKGRFRGIKRVPSGPTGAPPGGNLPPWTRLQILIPTCECFCISDIQDVPRPYSWYF